MSLNTNQLIQKFRCEDNPGHLMQLAEAIGREPLIRYINGLYGYEQTRIFRKLETACNHALFVQSNAASQPPTLH